MKWAILTGTQDVGEVPQAQRTPACSTNVTQWRDVHRGIKIAGREPSLYMAFSEYHRPYHTCGAHRATSLASFWLPHRQVKITANTPNGPTVSSAMLTAPVLNTCNFLAL